MAVDMFIKLEGIKGEATDSKHKDEIDVLSWAWGVTQSGSMHGQGGGGAGKANFNDLTFTKYMDIASPNLIGYTTLGKHIPTATLAVRKAGGSQKDYLTIALKEIIVTSVQTGGSGGEDRLTENVALNFAEFKFTYCKQKPDGELESPVEFAYNIKLQEKK